MSDEPGTILPSQIMSAKKSFADIYKRIRRCPRGSLNPVSLIPINLPILHAVNASSAGHCHSFADFHNQVISTSLLWLSKGIVAFVQAPSSQLPVLYISLLSIGVIVSPANSLGTPVDIFRQVHHSRPDAFFATIDAAHNLSSDPLGSPPLCWLLLKSSSRCLSSRIMSPADAFGTFYIPTSQFSFPFSDFTF